MEIIDEIFLFLREVVGFVFIICFINMIVYWSSIVINYWVLGDYFCSQCQIYCIFFWLEDRDFLCRYGKLSIFFYKYIDKIYNR